ncbi:acyltransferase family protein [Tardiphaga sp. vice278]|uniref:acyltransferase family protein n=1 Tax=Tardiphaga sp. vice278 TaxID=2592815 RepID=UPI00116444A7|nr:acyltransferase [Tardiphaga sp. vice278]QDM17957.1 acyltransferase [Tardiphaga sp. vice278]
MTATAAPETSRNIGLDLIRATAITLVLISHFGGLFTYLAGAGIPYQIFVAGYFGVELFFVLSGFLIGNLLLDICDRHVDLRAWRLFMTRRIMRTLPAYVFFLLVFLALLPPAQPLFHLVQYATLTQNLFWPMPADGWFGVSWSLTIEEWFYLTFSASLLFCVARLPRWGFWIALAAFLAIPLLGRLTVPPDAGWDSSLRKIVWLRLDAIAYGVLLARVLRNNGWLARHRMFALYAGLGLIALVTANWFLRIQSWDIHGYFWRTLIFNLTSVGFALLIPATLRIEINSPPLAFAITWLSRLSYGLYLVHLNLLVLAWPWLDSGTWRAIAGFALVLSGSFAIAWLSYRWLESPILRWRPLQRRGPLRSDLPSCHGGHLQDDAIR